MTNDPGQYQPAQCGALSPSTQWMVVPLAGAAGHSFWVWFFPSTAPQTVVVKLPWAQLGPAGVPVSLFSVCRSLHLSPTQFQCVQIGGQMFPVHSDFLLNEQSTGPDGEFSFLMASLQPQTPAVAPFGNAQMPVGQPVPQTSAPPTAAAAGAEIDERAYERADADWKSTVFLETQAATMRKQLAGTQSRLSSLNRDLAPEENRVAKRKDIADWSDARRFLRDAAAKLSRYMKDYDIGVTSSAGRRNWMETTYNQYIKPRQPFDQMDQMQREFEAYRKVLQHLVNNMTSAQAFAVQDGEQRAKQVLGRIRAQTKSNRTQARGKK
jgi:hypothetical protein